MPMSRTSVIAVITILLSALPLYGKKVICIDDFDDPKRDDDLRFLTCHEGFLIASGITEEDKVHFGENLLDCLDDVEDGDTLIIVAHGAPEGAGFWWRNQYYTGFGAGKGQGDSPHPVPEDFAELDNVKVEFCTCWSDRDPDGPKMPDRPLTEKIVDAMGGASRGHTRTGYQDIAWSDVCVAICYSGGNDNEHMTARQLVRDCLTNDTSWREKPPSNRKDTGGENEPPNQQSAAQAIVDACEGVPESVTVTVLIPNAVVEGEQAHGYKKPVNRPEQATPDGCDCQCGTAPGCGCSDFELDFILVTGVPAADTSAIIVLAIVLGALGAFLVVRSASR